MSDPSPQSQDAAARDAANWASGNVQIKVAAIPQGAVSLNVDGREVVGPLQGFGQLWQKTYRIALNGATVTPVEVVRVWKEHLPSFQPRQNRFFPALEGVEPGKIVLINATVSGMPVHTGVMVLYADDISFTLMTPQGHPESGWGTFSAFEEDGTVMCQVQSLARANDPLYEMGFRMAGAKAQEQIWRHVLQCLAAYFEVNVPVDFHKTCIDRRLQWNQIGNIRYNAAIRSALYTLTAPARWLAGAGKRSKRTAGES